MQPFAGGAGGGADVWCVANTENTTIGVSARIPIVHPRAAPPFPACTKPGPDFGATSVSLPAVTSMSSGACVGGVGAELSPLRTLLICPAFNITQTPARLQTRTDPSYTMTFM